MELTPKTGNPGLWEIAGLSDHGWKSLHMIDSQINDSMKVLFFTDPVEFGRGEHLKNYIQENNVGTVLESDVNLNPNSSRDLKIYLYTPDLVALKRWEATIGQALIVEEEKRIIAERDRRIREYGA